MTLSDALVGFLAVVGAGAIVIVGVRMVALWRRMLRAKRKPNEG